MSRWSPSAEDIASFHERGFLVRRDFLSAPETAALAAEVARLGSARADRLPAEVSLSFERASAGGERAVQQVLNVEVASEPIRELAEAPSQLDAVSALIGPDVALFEAKALPKTADTGGEIPWHQDFAYWAEKARGPFQVSCMIFLDDADEENGCLRVLAGSHLDGLRPHLARAATFGRSAPRDAREGGRETALAAPAGTAIFFGPLLLHGSAANRSLRSRRAITLVYTPADCDGPVRKVLHPATQSPGGGDEWSGAPRFVGPGPHGGQCAESYRRREVWKLAASRVADAAAPWIEITPDQSPSSEWFAAHKPEGNLFIRFEVASGVPSNRDDFRRVAVDLVARPSRAELEPHLVRGLGIVRLAGLPAAQTRSVLDRLAPGVRPGTVLIVETTMRQALRNLADRSGFSLAVLGQSDREAALEVVRRGASAIQPAGVDWRPAVAGIRVESGPTEDVEPRAARAALPTRFGRAARRAGSLLRPWLLRFFPRHRIPRFAGTGPLGELCPTHARRRELWSYALSLIEDPSASWCEFGVGEGESLDWFALRKPRGNRLLAFDSFEGIPEPWCGHPAGHWATPAFQANRPDVIVVAGRFQESLARADVRGHLGERIGLVHVDCDLYSSTRAVLEGLRDRLAAGTIVVFDEYYGYPGYERHEVRAFFEFVHRHGVAFDYLARSDAQVAVRLRGVGGRPHWSCPPAHWTPRQPGISLVPGTPLGPALARRLRKRGRESF